MLDLDPNHKNKNRKAHKNEANESTSAYITRWDSEWMGESANEQEMS